MATESLKWKVRRDPATRRVQCWEATDSRGYHFVIEGHGGFITVRHYTLQLYHYGRGPYLILTFYKLAKAQQWAEQLVNGGAKVEPIMCGPAYI